MALNDIILGKDEIIVILSDSTSGMAADGVALNFGTVQVVNQLSDRTTVGQSVLLDIKDALPFMIISGQRFYKINENSVTLTEETPPP